MNSQKNWQVSYADNWQEWIDIANGHQSKDQLLFPQMSKWFHKDEQVLELGSGVGQLSKYAANSGYDVLSSDFEPKFVNYMNENGLKAREVDAFDIAKSTSNEKWKTIFTQGASPFVGTNMEAVETAYKSVYESLKNEGRFVILIARTPRNRGFSRLSDHDAIIKKCGFDIVYKTRNQVLPSRLYGNFAATFIEKLLGNNFGIRELYVLDK